MKAKHIFTILLTLVLTQGFATPSSLASMSKNALDSSGDIGIYTSIANGADRLGLISDKNSPSPIFVLSLPVYRVQGFHIYLPCVVKPQDPVRIVITQNVINTGYGYSIYGYFTNLTSETLYSVILELEITQWTPPIDDPPPSTYFIPLTPVLPATLPGQINFFKDVSYNKYATKIGPVRFVRASSIDPNGEVYYPLTVLAWDHNLGGLFGTVRNDSNQSLHKVRIIAFNPEKCVYWGEAELALTMLQPGQKTTFSVDYPEVCLDEDLVIVGQGAAQQ